VHKIPLPRERPVDTFIAQVAKPVRHGVALRQPIRHQAKNRLLTTEDGLPHRSARVAVQGRHRVSNPETQAQNVLMKKWQVTSEARSLDADALRDSNTIFRSPLGSSHRKAIRAHFTAKDMLPMVEAMDIEP
jgi:hypothetical protein